MTLLGDVHKSLPPGILAVTTYAPEDDEFFEYLDINVGPLELSMVDLHNVDGRISLGGDGVAEKNIEADVLAIVCIITEWVRAHS